MKALRIFMYTKGTGSGHLARINSVFKGFQRSGYKFEFFACAYRSKYKDYLHPEINLVSKNDIPNIIDIFICDWKDDEYITALTPSLSKVWVGLRRLGKIKSTFPTHFHVIAIEPGVKGDITIYPIINTFKDELKSRRELFEVLGIPESEKKITLLCENGSYSKHVEKVLSLAVDHEHIVLKSSNSPFSKELRNLSYYPVAELFSAVDYLVIGGGYNSVHEAMCYANLKKTKIVKVGGDDQEHRIKRMIGWEQSSNSKADKLAIYLIEELFYNKKHDE